MAKRVFSTIGETCHEWAHNWRSLGNGRNSTGNLYFEQETIYSYGAHFPLARMTKAADGETVVLFNPDSYSNSTARHQNNVRSAVSHIKSYTVPNLEPRNNADHLENWTHLRSNLNAARNEISKTRNLTAWYIESAQNLAGVCNNYVRCFNVKGLEAHQSPIVAYSDPELSELRQLIDRNEVEREIRAEQARAQNEIATAARIEAEAIRDAKQARLELFERLTFGLYKAPRPTWKYGYQGHQTSKPTRNDLAELKAKISAWKRCESGARFPQSYKGATLMRLNGDIVETSQHANFPVSDCVALWPLIETCKQTGQRSENPDGLRMGTFPVNHISETGDVKASCHFISYAECRKLAIILELIKPTTAERLAYKARKLTKALAIS